MADVVGFDELAGELSASPEGVLALLDVLRIKPTETWTGAPGVSEKDARRVMTFARVERDQLVERQRLLSIATEEHEAEVRRVYAEASERKRLMGRLFGSDSMEAGREAVRKFLQKHPRPRLEDMKAE